MSLLILVSISIGRFLFLDNLILVVRDVQRSPIAEVVVYLVIPVQGDFPSPTVYHTQIGVRWLEAYDSRCSVVFQQDVRTVFLIVVESGTQTVVP